MDICPILTRGSVADARATATPLLGAGARPGAVTG
jgi:hypothetical protein